MKMHPGVREDLDAWIFLGSFMSETGPKKRLALDDAPRVNDIATSLPKMVGPNINPSKPTHFNPPLFLYPPCSNGKAQRLTFLVGRRRRLNHMHLHDAERALQRFAQTGARYLLTNVRPDGGSGRLFLWGFEVIFLEFRQPKSTSALQRKGGFEDWRILPKVAKIALIARPTTPRCYSQPPSQKVTGFMWFYMFL